MAIKFTLPNVSPRPSLPVSPRKRRPLGVISACAGRERNGRDREGSGKIVDENMIVLRMRIRDTKMSEIGHDRDQNRPPSDWMEWEKQYFVYYEEDVLEGIGLLQNYLMNIRPCLALAYVALLTLSVPISSGLVIFHVMEITKHVLSRFLLTYVNLACSACLLDVYSCKM